MRLSIQYFWSKKTKAFILYLLSDCAKLLSRNYGKVKSAELRELIALTALWVADMCGVQTYLSVDNPLFLQLSQECTEIIDDWACKLDEAGAILYMLFLNWLEWVRKTHRLHFLQDHVVGWACAEKIDKLVNVCVGIHLLASKPLVVEEAFIEVICALCANLSHYEHVACQLVSYQALIAGKTTSRVADNFVLICSVCKALELNQALDCHSHMFVSEKEDSSVRTIGRTN